MTDYRSDRLGQPISFLTPALFFGAGWLVPVEEPLDPLQYSYFINLLNRLPIIDLKEETMLEHVKILFQWSSLQTVTLGPYWKLSICLLPIGLLSILISKLVQNIRSYPDDLEEGYSIAEQTRKVVNKRRFLIRLEKLKVDDRSSRSTDKQCDKNATEIYSFPNSQI
ncbi:hypothetical protein BY996DRAFT_3273728 [Phakopsora pachyrhizi]|nr:hypothetical protein BY996DRAFT_3273728 [Phakopsora pachyrhizi]